MIRLTLYSKPDCELCEPFRAAVESVTLSVKWRNRVTLEYVNIEEDRAAWEKYREKIPVLEIDGKLAFKYFLDEGDLLAYLERRLTSRRTNPA